MPLAVSYLITVVNRSRVGYSVEKLETGRSVFVPQGATVLVDESLPVCDQVSEITAFALLFRRGAADPFGGLARFYLFKHRSLPIWCSARNVRLDRAAATIRDPQRLEVTIRETLDVEVDPDALQLTVLDR